MFVREKENGQIKKNEKQEVAGFLIHNPACNTKALYFISKLNVKLSQRNM